MSNRGPAPRANRNSGFGCQASGPGTWNSVVAVSGSPMSPRAMARMADWIPAPSTVSGAHATCTPAARAASSRSWPDSWSSASGFSLHTCLPAATIRRPTSACVAGSVRFTTISISSIASRSSTVPWFGTPCSSARERARSRSMSATNRTSRSGIAVMFSRYVPEMTPAPMTPTPTRPVPPVTCRSPAARRATPRCRRTRRRRSRRTRRRAARGVRPRARRRRRRRPGRRAPAS